MMTKYPNISVRLTGKDGNAFAIIGRVTDALRRGGARKEEREQFIKEATSSDYDHLLYTCAQWVDVQ